MPPMNLTEIQALLEPVMHIVSEPGVFDEATLEDDALRLDAQEVDADGEAFYAVRIADADTAWVSFETTDRWLSESIEADLMHVGDKIEELLDEELVDQGWDEGPLPVEHFRDDAKRYVFRSPIKLQANASRDADQIAKVVLAYEACFCQLGDMKREE